MSGLSGVRCAICGRCHQGGCRLYPTFVSERTMFDRLSAMATEAGAAANTHSQNGGDECEAPLELAIEVLRGTGLGAREPGSE